jgi:hypothetical protein
MGHLFSPAYGLSLKPVFGCRSMMATRTVVFPSKDFNIFWRILSSVLNFLCPYQLLASRQPEESTIGQAQALRLKLSKLSHTESTGPTSTETGSEFKNF